MAQGRGSYGKAVAGLALAVVAATLLAAPLAEASRNATQSEARAIKRGFLKGREVETQIRTIRVSTADRRYAAVSYKVEIPQLGPVSLRAGAEATETDRAPSPVILKKKRKAWKRVARVPLKVKKDLKARPGSDIAVTGEAVAVLKRPASCSETRDFYSAGVYDPGSDTYLSVEFPSWRGPGVYPALGVRSVASLAVGNGGGAPQFETGLGSDAFSPSGDLYVDPDGWGIIEATMARQPDGGGTYPQSVLVNGYWDCR